MFPSTKIIVFFDAVLCSLVRMRTATFHRIIIHPSLLMMEAAGFSETCLNISQTEPCCRKRVIFMVTAM